jgi:SWI/SNF-related matrix-associated actin-dependent regulator 1 of chromatin subfamily A
MEATLPVAQIGNEQAFDADEVVYLAVKYLAGNCDGAAKRDDVGYNRLHAGLGHKLAEIPLSQWSDRQFWAARKMLETYRNTQLAFLWPMMPPLPPEPPKHPHEAARDSAYAEYKRSRDPNWQPPRAFRRLALRTIGGSPYIELQQSYDEALIDQIKRLPQRRFIDETKHDPNGSKYWVVPIHLDTLEAVTSFAVENGYDIPPNVERAIETAMTDFTERLMLSHAADGDFEIDLPAGLELYPFQRIGVQFALKAGNTLVADEMGLGKTVQALSYLRVTGRFPAVIVCPASLKRNWQREFKKWLPGKTVAVLDGKVVAPLKWFDQSPAFDAVILNYDILAKWLPYLVDYLGGKLQFDDRNPPRQIPFDGGSGVLILDECHKVKNPKAQRTHNVEKLVKACGGVNRLFLSGTPVVNRPMEFWTLISLLGYDRQMGGRAEYERRYKDGYIRALEELNTRSRQFMVRRTKKQVLTELPDKQRTIVPLDITNRSEYEKAERDIAAYFAQKKADEALALDDLVSIQIEALQMGLVGNDGLAWVQEEMKRRHRDVYDARYSIAKNNEQLLRWEGLKQLAVRGKMPAVYDWLDDFLESGQPIVVFGTHTQIIKDIAARYDAPYVIGALSSDERDRNVQRFLTDDNCRMIVGNINAMGEGLTLVKASDVAFVEMGWSPKDHDQAEDRCHRIGQKDSVMVWTLAAEDTIDFEIAELIEHKRQVVNAMTDGAGKVTQEEFMRELQDRLLTRLEGRSAAK